MSMFQEVKGKHTFIFSPKEETVRTYFGRKMKEETEDDGNIKRGRYKETLEKTVGDIRNSRRKQWSSGPASPQRTMK